MKPLPLILLAILIQLAIKFFWDYVSDNLYYAGYALVMLLWVVAFNLKTETTKTLSVITGWWTFWIVNDFMKELSHLTGFLGFLFLDPTKKYLSEYIIFAISTGYVIYRLKHSK